MMSDNYWRITRKTDYGRKSYNISYKLSQVSLSTVSKKRAKIVDNTRKNTILHYTQRYEIFFFSVYLICTKVYRHDIKIQIKVK